MKKNITIAFILLLVLSGSIYAKGQDDDRYYPRQGGPDYGWNYDEQESVDLVGNLELINGNPPYLVSGADKYLLMVPYHLLYDLDIQDGEEISVTGYETAGHMWQWDDSEKALFVTSAEIKGEEYNLSGYGGYMRGGRGGFGRGGRGCW
jgi:hypothetical protein